MRRSRSKGRQNKKLGMEILKNMQTLEVWTGMYLRNQIDIYKPIDPRYQKQSTQ